MSGPSRLDISTLLEFTLSCRALGPLIADMEPNYSGGREPPLQVRAFRSPRTQSGASELAAGAHRGVARVQRFVRRAKYKDFILHRRSGAPSHTWAHSPA